MTSNFKIEELMVMCAACDDDDDDDDCRENKAQF